MAAHFFHERRSAVRFPLSAPVHSKAVESAPTGEGAPTISDRRLQAESGKRKAESGKPDRWLALGLFLLLAGVGVLLAAGHTYARDDETMFVSAESLVDLHWFAIPEGVPVMNVARGVDGRQYSSYGPLQTLAIVPFIWLGRLLAGTLPVEYYGYFGRLAAGFMNPLAHAIAATLIFLIGRQLGFRRRGAVSVALIFTFSTWEWVHSRTLFSEPLTIVWLLLAVYCLLRATGYELRAMGNDAPSAYRLPFSTRWLIAGGFAVAALLATRIQEVIVVPLLGLYLLWAAWRAMGGDVKGVVKWAALWGGALLVGVIPLMLYQWALFGNPFKPAYSNTTEIFEQEPYIALYGWIFSAGAGLLWFAPALWFGGIAWPRFWRAGRPVALLFGLLILIHALFYAGYPFWWGGGAWGPRYLAPALPFMLLPLGMLWQPGLGGARSWFDEGARRLRVAALLVFVLAGVLTEGAGVVVNFDTYITTQPDPPRHFEPYYSSIAGHLRLLGDRLGEWGPQFGPPRPGLVLATGFSFSEGKDGAPLPRWTLDDALMKVYTAGDAATLRLRIEDHRPPELPRGQWTIMLNGQPVQAQVTPTGGPGDERLVVFSVPAGQNPALVEIKSDTWNPQDAREQPIGIYIATAELAIGATTAPVVGLPQIPPAPTLPQGRFGWFLRPDIAHLADHWLWYLTHSGLPGSMIVSRAVAIIAAALLLLLAGMLCLGRARVPRTKYPVRS